MCHTYYMKLLLKCDHCESIDLPLFGGFYRTSVCYKCADKGLKEVTRTRLAKCRQCGNYLPRRKQAYCSYACAGKWYYSEKGRLAARKYRKKKQEEKRKEILAEKMLA